MSLLFLASISYLLRFGLISALGVWISDMLPLKIFRDRQRIFAAMILDKNSNICFSIYDAWSFLDWVTMLSENLANFIKNSAHLFNDLLNNHNLSCIVGLNFVQVFLIGGVNQVSLEVELWQLQSIIFLTWVGNSLLIIKFFDVAFQVHKLLVIRDLLIHLL